MLGAKSPDKVNDKVDSGRGQTFMMHRPEYLVPCCGIITEWQVYIQKPGTMRFQVWRALGTGEYELMGENLATYNKGEEGNLFELSLDTTDAIAVKAGDFIGWYNADDSMVSYKKEKSGLGVLIMSTGQNNEVGAIVDWASTKSSEPRTYAIQATVNKADKPKFQNLDSGISLVDNISPGTEIYRITLKGVDGVSVPPNFSVSFDTYSEYFGYNKSENSVIILQSPLPGKYTLEFTVTDHCGEKDRGKLKVEVKTKLPAILNLPAAVSVGEDVENEERFLMGIDVVHSSLVTCELNDVSPSNGRHFFLVRNVNGSVPEVYLKASARLDYDVADSFELTIKCSAGKSSDTGSLFVNVEQNKVPKFTNLPSSVLIDADQGLIGGAIFYVTAEDEENNPVTYNISCDPEPCPFSITRGGSIVIVDDIRRAVSNIFYIKVFLEDDFNEASPEILLINITGLNRPPFIYNLPDKMTVTIEEHAPPMTSLFQVLAVDPDVNDTLTFSLTAKPTNMIPLFTINETTGEIYVVTSLNYESLKSKNIKLYPSVSDGLSSFEGSLKVSIIDVNEAPQFQYNEYTVYTGENKKGFALAKDLITATDLDKNDVITYGLDCGKDTPLFSINVKNADINQEYELDVDELGDEERVIKCKVSATDTFGMSNSASLHVIVSDDNDNPPLFQRTSYVFLATRDIPLFSVIGQAVATDLDSAPLNRRLFYYISENTNDFAIDDNGTIYLTKDLTTVPVGTTFKLTLNVEDSKRSNDMAPLTVLILAGDYSALVSSLMVEELTFFSLPENMAWFVTAVHLGVVLCALVLYICSKIFLGCSLKTLEIGIQDDIMFTKSKSVEEFLWNNLDKTGSRTPSMVSTGNETFQQQPNRKLRSSSLTPVLEITGQGVHVAADDTDRTGGSDKSGPSCDVTRKLLDFSKTKSNPGTRRESFRSTKSFADLPTVQSHLSLSEIDAGVVDASPSPWKPWAVSDFADFSLQDFEQENDMTGNKAFSVTERRKMSVQSHINLNF